MKLTDAQVSEIRELWMWGSSASDLGPMFGVTVDHVRGIVKGDTRKRTRLTPVEIKAKNAARCRAWNAAHVDRKRAHARTANKRHRQRHPELYRFLDNENFHRRKRAIGGGRVTLSQWHGRLEEFGHACAYCLRTDVRLTKDHVTALASGGAHEIENIVPSCQACNCAKGRRGVLYMAGRVRR